RGTFFYARVGRVVEARRTIAALGETFVSRTDYGLDGTVHRHTYPDGYHVPYEYDEHHRLAAVRGREAGGAEQLLLHGAVHDDLDRLVEVTLGNGTRVHHEYDAFGRRVATRHESADGEVLFSERLHLNDGSQIVGAEETLAGVDPVIVEVPPESRPTLT